MWFYITEACSFIGLDVTSCILEIEGSGAKKGLLKFQVALHDGRPMPLF